MEHEKLMHDLIVSRLKGKFAGLYKEITINSDGNPDLVLSSHGLTLAVVQVETDTGITPERAEKWKELAQSGSKLILMVPKNAKAKVMDLLWKSGIADKVGVGSYEIAIHMP